VFLDFVMENIMEGPGNSSLLRKEKYIAWNI
jgi:hypothetical protein